MRALRPSCGASAACEGCPWNSKVSQSDARVGWAIEIAIEGMKHHGGIDAVEDARLNHLDFAASPLLRGSAQENDLAAGRLGHGRRRDEGPDGAGRDQVVAARVTDPGQRVVLRQDGGARTSPLSSAGSQRGGHSANAVLDPVAPGGHELAEPRARFVLLEAELGVSVDAPRKRDEVLRRFVDGAIDRGSEFRRKGHDPEESCPRLEGSSNARSPGHRRSPSAVVDGRMR